MRIVLWGLVLYSDVTVLTFHRKSSSNISDQPTVLLFTIELLYGTRTQVWYAYSIELGRSAVIQLIPKADPKVGLAVRH